ncbi:MAG: hypothetical protein SFV51_25975 [Bryobacteraceae bacterium]|nr:hypothetical protein [Bryobacteraceae bacterium]
MKRLMAAVSAGALALAMGAWAHQGGHHGQGKGGDCESCCKKGRQQGKKGRNRPAPAPAPEQAPQPEKK